MSQVQRMYRVFGPAECPVAQSAELLLGLHGGRVQRQIGPRARLVVRHDEAMLMLAEGGPDMFDLIGKLNPWASGPAPDPDLEDRQHRLTNLAFRAMSALEQVIVARNLRDLDISVHALRGFLIQIDKALPGAALSDLPTRSDAALLPLFWRVALLDLRHQAHLGDGLLEWTHRSAGMLRDPRLVFHFDRQAGRRFLDGLARHGSALACDPRDEDWSGAFAALAPAMVIPLKKPHVSHKNNIHYHVGRV